MSAVSKGDRVVILRDNDSGSTWLRAGAFATVDYLLPDYGKVICRLDEPVGVHKSCCLYDSQFGEHWTRAAQGTEARRAETATEIGGSVHDGPVPNGDAP